MLALHWMHRKGNELENGVMRQGEGQEDLAVVMGVPLWQFTRSRMALRLTLQQYINVCFQSLRPYKKSLDAI